MAYKTSVMTQFNIYAVPTAEYARLSAAGEIDENALYLVADEIDPDSLPKLGIADIKQTAASDEAGGANTITITLSDGSVKEFTLLNFSGTPGKDGADGRTPERGVDYWTDVDKQEVINSVLAALPDGEAVSY